MQDILSSVAPLGFERLSPLVNLLEVAGPPPLGPVRADKAVGPTAGAAGTRLAGKGASAPHSGPDRRARIPVERNSPSSVHSAPTGIALLSPSAGYVLLEAQAEMESR